MYVTSSGWGIKQLFWRSGTAGSNDYQSYVRTYQNSTSKWSEWNRFLVENDLDNINTDIESINSKVTLNSANTIYFGKSIHSSYDNEYARIVYVIYGNICWYYLMLDERIDRDNGNIDITINNLPKSYIEWCNDTSSIHDYDIILQLYMQKNATSIRLSLYWPSKDSTSTLTANIDKCGMYLIAN